MNEMIDQITSNFKRDQYGMYLRKSRADMEMEALGEGETLARHLHMLEALAARHDIHPDQITIYKEVVSGESIDDRPEMQRLLNDVYQKKYAGVLVVEVERLARGNTKDQGEVAEAFQMSNTKIITPAKIYNPNDEFDQEYFEFGLFMSRREYKTIRRRLESGKLQSALEGNYLPAQRIFGFDVIRKSKKDRLLVERPQESKIVQMMFDWLTKDGWSTYKIASELKKMKIPNTAGSVQWSRSTVRDMLQNPHYIGMIVWGKYKTVKVFDEKTGKTIKKRIKSSPQEQKIIKGKHKGFINPEQFALAKEMLKATVPVNLEKKIINPLAGLLRCNECGNVIPRQAYNDRRLPRYTHATGYPCSKKSLACQDVLSALVQSLKEYISDFEMKMKSGDEQTELIRHQKTIEVMETELAKQETRKRRLMDSWESDDGTYTRDEFVERKQMYTNTIDKLKAQIQEARLSTPAPVDYSEQIINLHAMIDCIEDDDIDAEAKNDFLKQFISEIKFDVIDLGRKKGGIPVLDVILK